MSEVINQLSGYETSRDYERLADAMRRGSVVCVVDYEFAEDDVCRDIAHTVWYDGEYRIKSRGMCYLSAWSRDVFIRLCQKYNVEAIFPPERRNA